jgi:2-polyprenyl-3-methyl-5-hydroxy-6-metoxy-1,4-benzoquinol methylase
MACNSQVAGGYIRKNSPKEGTARFNHLEVPNISRLLGNIEGLRVLDLGCGAGRFTR